MAFYSGANNLYDSLNLGSSTVLSLNSDGWDTVAYTFNGIPERLIYFHDTLILEGPNYINADTVEGIAYLDGDHWESYPQPTEIQVQRFRVLDDTLYAAGATDGLFQPFFRLVNGAWEQFGAMAGSGGINIGLDIIKWNGGYYGAIAGAQDGEGLYHLEGGLWYPLSPEVVGTAQPGYLAEFQGDLYIAGGLMMGSGAPGNGICRYDGQAFHPLGMGLQSWPGNDNSVCGPSDMIAHNGLLFVAHSCNYAGGLPSGDIAAWDGERWCTVQGLFEDGVSSMDFMGDTLYVGCGASVDGIPVGHAARFIGPQFTDSCVTITFVPVLEPGSEALTVYPNPAVGSVSLNLAGSPTAVVRLYVLDALGRTVWSGVGPTHVVDITDWSPGMFTVSATDGLRITRHARLVVR